MGRADLSAGSVAAAILTTSGKYLHGCLHRGELRQQVCAEHAAVAEMIKARETQIAMIVAVCRDGVLPPCGRCRELLVQVNPKNFNAKVILAGDRVVAVAYPAPRTLDRKPRQTARRLNGYEMLHSKLPDEIEIKLRIADRSAVIRRLLALNAKLQVARVHEMNTLYDMAGGMLARQGQMLRVRVERAADFSRARRGQPDDEGGLRKHPYKIRTELEVSVSDADGIVGILEAIGFGPCFRYMKAPVDIPSAAGPGAKREP